MSPGARNVASEIECSYYIREKSYRFNLRIMIKAAEDLSFIFSKLKMGDKDALSFFYRYFINDMYAYGKSLGIKDEYVMDAIQDVFLKIIFNKLHLDSVEHFKYFLLKSLKNKLYDFYRSKSFSNTENLMENIFNFSIETTVLDEIIEEEDRTIIQNKVEKLFASLSPLQKEAVYLRYIQELDYEQISGIMDKTENSVRKLVSQAINKIRKDGITLLFTTFF